MIYMHNFKQISPIAVECSECGCLLPDKPQDKNIHICNPYTLAKKIEEAYPKDEVKKMEDISRIITEREVFDTKFLIKWNTCLKLAYDKVKEIAIAKSLDFSMADILSATAQLFICWNQNNGYILSEQKRMQEEVDKKFNQPIIKKDA